MAKMHVDVAGRLRLARRSGLSKHSIFADHTCENIRRGESNTTSLVPSHKYITDIEVLRGHGTVSKSTLLSNILRLMDAEKNVFCDNKISTVVHTRDAIRITL
ncbi:hypothetical protein E4U21_000387 [Claviceps maximensis]|nr:hypothetical protein E4U21_000387 [Claviceps maximensis]